ncbi:uncharacterized protein LOC132838509 isoform X2 [Tachysurus vachellii]|uniref:uncharacterized protein LOC132838509 isoform X2 n=1 Tax=Tachysurus vachellii TaxID=175792 RepID=UPI00296AB797|nr:uncharacterized protein LOC132838509 isoform X2 [Tachysurus vachellii]
MSSSTKYSDIGTHSDPTTVPLKYSDIGTHSDPTTVPLKSSTVNTTFGDFLESSEGTQDRTFTDMTSTVSTAFGDFLESSEGTQDRTFTDMTSTVSTTFGDFLDSSAGTQDRTFTDMRAEMNPYVTVQTGSSATHDDLAGVFVFGKSSFLGFVFENLRDIRFCVCVCVFCSSGFFITDCATYPFRHFPTHVWQERNILHTRAKRNRRSETGTV